MADTISVEITVTCTVSTLNEAESALRSIREGCERDGWQIKDAWFRAPLDTKENA